MDKIVELTIDQLDNVSGGTAPEYRRYANPGSGWSVNLLEGGKALVTSPLGAQHQIHITPKGTLR